MNRVRSLGQLVLLSLLGGLISLMLAGAPAQSLTVASVDFLGQVSLPTGFVFQGTEVGGLSGITYDVRRQLYYSISDDRSQKAPARFYTLTIDLSQGALKEGGVTLTDVTTLLAETGQPFAPLSLDPEGIALTRRGSLFIASEGDSSRQINPFVKEFSRSGQSLKTLPVPAQFLPAQNRGVRNNLAFESLTLTPDQTALFTATEAALLQDGPEATVEQGSPSRILKYNPRTGQPEQEFLYLTEPVAAPPNATHTAGNNGLVDLLALDRHRLLSLERAFSAGIGNTIRLFEVSLAGATDLQGLESLSTVDLTTLKPVQKRLLLDFKDLKIPLDNLEGLTFGPEFADGRRALVVVSDNNFNPLQVTQFLAFGVRLAR